ncbi:MAG TPA: nucleotidyltransferase [archaeon]|nr:nucleotidyltransferase [archaeon]
MSGVLSRENEVIRLISLLSDNNLDFIVVGGYAVSIHKKRFSIDLDIVVKEADVNKFENLLEKEDYVSGYSKEISTVYDEKFKRLEKKIGKLSVSVDLLINGVVSRLTGGSWSYELLLENSSKSMLQGTEFLAPSKEMLVAMKIHSGRFSDVRDIVALYENTDQAVILKYAKRGDIKKLKTGLQKEINFMESPNFKDSFKGIFGFHVYKEQDIRNAVKGLRAMLKKL